MSSNQQPPMWDDIAISVRNLTKTYRLFNHPGDRVKQFLSLGFKQYHRKFTALEGVSFDITKGETVGIIGRNGSGKSTLLQLICGILKPTSGSVRVNGRISALLELGAGFNPEFTGRENVYFQGALTGFTQGQMDERFDAIISFAEIGDFIDQPVRTYSSGMFMRLAFAVAVNLDPDILVVDEALAVGDSVFQSRCFERIDKIRENGGTVVFVSHALEQIAHHCNTAYLLEKGTLTAKGTTSLTLTAYIKSIEGGTPRASSGRSETCATKDTVHIDQFAQHPWYSQVETRWGDGKARISNVQICQDGTPLDGPARMGHSLEIQLVIDFLEYINHPIFGLTIKSQQGAEIYSINSHQLSTPLREALTGSRVLAIFRLTPFLDRATYLLSFGVASESTTGIRPHDRRYDAIILNIEMPRIHTGEPEMFPEFELRPLTS